MSALSFASNVCFRSLRVFTTTRRTCITPIKKKLERTLEKNGRQYTCILLTKKQDFLAHKLHGYDSEAFRFQRSNTRTSSSLSLIDIEKFHLGSYRFPYGGGGGYCPRVRIVYSIRLNDLSNLYSISYRRSCQD